MDGYIHSIESFGTVDGPGIRLVVFCQGCPMRCRYCHNPDTWEIGKGMRMSPREILALYERNKAFYQRGGITVTGGEPLLQMDFLLELFTMAKAEGIHTCIDTSGATYREGESEYNDKLDRLLERTDLVMLDIKHMDAAAHRALTGKDNAGILSFARHVSDRGVPLWIRHVVVPGVTDDAEQLAALGRWMAELKSVKALDVLPYHTMGVAKYRELNIPYPLEGIEPASKAQAAEAKRRIMESFTAARRAKR